MCDALQRANWKMLFNESAPRNMYRYMQMTVRIPSLPSPSSLLALPLSPNLHPFHFLAPPHPCSLLPPASLLLPAASSLAPPLPFLLLFPSPFPSSIFSFPDFCYRLFYGRKIILFNFEQISRSKKTTLKCRSPGRSRKVPEGFPEVVPEGYL